VAAAVAEGQTLPHAAVVTSVECPICEGGGPTDVVAELPATWATAPAIAALPGYVCVVSKHHVVEPYELSAEGRIQFWNDCLAVAQALAAALLPVKMNYEIHGNTIPHLHMHLYPRYAGDPYEGRAIDGSARFMRDAAEVGRLRRALAAAENQARAD